MSGIKIKIEGGDLALRAAIATSIAEGLKRDDFTNVKAKVTMVYTEVDRDVGGAPSRNFSKRSILVDGVETAKPGLTEVIIVSPEIAVTYPACIEHVKDATPAKLETPILIDMDCRPQYQERAEEAFFKGEEAPQLF
jgi:hypothetical protein